MALRASAPTITVGPQVESPVIQKSDIIDKTYGDIGCTPMQTAFHADDSKLRHIIGEPGSGKTFAGLTEALWHSIAYQGNQGAIFTLNPKDVGCSLFNKAIKILPEEVCEWDTRRDIVSIRESHVFVLDVSKMQSIRGCMSMKLGWLMFEHPDLYPEETHRSVILRRLGRQDTPQQAWYISKPDDTPQWLVNATDCTTHCFGYVNINLEMANASLPADYMRELGESLHRNQRENGTPRMMRDWSPLMVEPENPPTPDLSDTEIEAFLAKIDTLLDDDTLEEEVTDVPRSVRAV